MAELHLPSLEIIGFRGFEHLRIEKLGAVNLIAGKNNVGKTSLLEALQLYALRGTLDGVLQMLEARDEGFGLMRTGRNYHDHKRLLSALKYIFHGRENVSKGEKYCTIGPLGDSLRTLEIAIVRAEDLAYSKDKGTVRDDRFSTLSHVVREELFFLGKDGPLYSVKYGSEQVSIVPMMSMYDFFPWERYLDGSTEVSALPNSQIPPNGLSRAQLARLWDTTALTEWEKDVVGALQILAPDVERISMVESGEFDDEREKKGERIPIVRLRSEFAPLPLKSLGEGMNRLFGIVLALVNARSGLLLIDEIESGLHYSVQPDIWKLIFSVARSLNVQVFATTHSWDCIQAFQQAACEHEQSEGMLIRLQNESGRITSTLFDERRLAIATREQIEVR